MYTTRSPDVLAIFMNNRLSYCGLVDTRISASEKNLPVSNGHWHECSKQAWIWSLSRLYNSSDTLKAIWEKLMEFLLFNEVLKSLIFSQSPIKKVGDSNNDLRTQIGASVPDNVGVIYR